MDMVQAVKKLNSISWELLNFRRRPILCTTLHRNPMQVSNFGGLFDQLFLWIFLMKFSQKMPLSFFETMMQKVKKWPKTQSRGGGSLALSAFVKAQNWSLKCRWRGKGKRWEGKPEGETKLWISAEECVTLTQYRTSFRMESEALKERRELKRRRRREWGTWRKENGKSGDRTYGGNA